MLEALTTHLTRAAGRDNDQGRTAYIAEENSAIGAEQLMLAQMKLIEMANEVDVETAGDNASTRRRGEKVENRLGKAQRAQPAPASQDQ